MTEIRQKLFDYILNAEDGKVEAMYLMIENELDQSKDVWSNDFLTEMNARVKEFETGTVKGSTWEQVKGRFGK